MSPLDKPPRSALDPHFLPSTQGEAAIDHIIFTRTPFVIGTSGTSRTATIIRRAWEDWAMTHPLEYMLSITSTPRAVTIGLTFAGKMTLSTYTVATLDRLSASPQATKDEFLALLAKSAPY